MLAAAVPAPRAGGMGASVAPAVMMDGSGSDDEDDGEANQCSEDDEDGQGIEYF
eukprot:gene24435-10034_t